MNILVLGSTGFIGENLVNSLKGGDYSVYTCERSSGVDIREYKQIRDKIAEVKPQVIFNLASHGGSLHYVREFAADVFHDNMLMSINLYKAVKEVVPGCKIVNTFSNCSYPGKTSVQLEEDWLDGQVHPSVFSFGSAKRAVYYLSQCYYNQYGIKSVNLLFPNTFGPGDSIDPNHTHAINGMIIRMMKAKRAGEKKFIVWGTGQPVREWAYIDDFVNILASSIQLDNIIYPINVGQNRGYSIADSAKMIKDEMGYDGEIIFDTSYSDGDPVKILSDKKFREYFPKFIFFNHRQGISEAIKFYEGAL